MLSQTAEYALRAVLFLGDLPPRTLVRVNDVADALQVPRNYLSKVLYELARRGILSSLRGPQGGFSLARDPESLTLAEVVEPFDPFEDRCLLMRRQCDDADPCLAHNQWKQVAGQVRSFFRNTTVGDLLDTAPESAHPSVARALASRR
jgi:Rrf2 family transcriptional regulator, iron-sulfur cluster assembly transcription factor